MMAIDREAVIARAKADRRRYRRIDVDLGGKIFLPSDEREAACKVLDLSPGGARISCEFDLPTDTTVILYIDGFGRLEGNIVRLTGGAFGVEFHCSALKRERIAEQLTAFINRDIVDETVVRRHDRTPTRGLARFTRASGEIVSCEVLDLSLGGVSLKTDRRPPVGEIVLIGQMAGRIARHHENGIGIEFVTPVPAVVPTERQPVANIAANVAAMR